jgi:hypothetical protein
MTQIYADKKKNLRKSASSADKYLTYPFAAAAPRYLELRVLRGLRGSK